MAVAIFLVLFCFIMCIREYILYRKLYNPSVLFFALWGFILFFYSLRLFDVYEASSQALFVICIGLIGSAIGLGVGDKIVITLNRQRNVDLDKEKQRNSLFFVISFAITAMVCSFFASRAIGYLLSGVSLREIRYVISGKIYKDSGILDILFTYFALPMTFLFLHIFMYMLFSGKCNRYVVIVCLAFFALSIILIQGGRFVLLYLVIDAIILQTIYKKKWLSEKEKSKNVSAKIGRYIILCAVVGFLVITLGRGNNLFGVFKGIYTYLCGCVTHLSIMLEEFNGEFTNGLYSLNGFIRSLYKILGLIGFSMPEKVAAIEDIVAEVEAAKYIAPDIVYNAFVTMFYFFYVDGGYVAVALYSVVLGVIVKKSYSKINLSDLQEDKIIWYLMIMQLLMTSMVRFQMSIVSFAMMFVYYYLIYNNFLQQFAFTKNGMLNSKK